ncbi:hypothetical protein G3436_14815 [Pseudomonas sp. MAFF212427]|uniref:Uncharacterized protein n=1 Tax=Pseudomonas brassicae TaxID=2708063 RepID=A0A6B3NT61_9PSED|nr:hypothetical protein [Pseudomonas brassicae]NER64913.1 hypothetical protein [Pseudomonas brassicae]
MDERSFGLFKPSELKVDVLPFDSLKRFGESQYGNSESAEQALEGQDPAPPTQLKTRSPHRPS